MRNVLSNQQARGNLSSSRERMRSVTLWTMQGALALLFLFTGGSKLLLPTTVLLARWLFRCPSGSSAGQRTRPRIIRKSQGISVIQRSPVILVGNFILRGHYYYF